MQCAHASAWQIAFDTLHPLPASPPRPMLHVPTLPAILSFFLSGTSLMATTLLLREGTRRAAKRQRWKQLGLGRGAGAL